MREENNSHLERELIAKIAAKDKAAFERFYHLYNARLGRYLWNVLRRNELVDEALNDTLLAVWQTAARYDPMAGNVLPWIYGIAHNKALKIYALSTRHTKTAVNDDILTENSALPSAAVDTLDPEHLVRGWQLGENLDRALQALTPQHRAVLELAFVDNLPYADIAAIMACPINTVKTRILYARKRLGEVLIERGLAQ